MNETPEHNRLVITTGVAVLFAIAAGIAVSNLYWAQPLLAQIATEFGVDSSTAGFLVTATQIGYAVGILCLVPLGDKVNRRKMLVIVLLANVICLLASALAPTMLFLAFAFSAVGFSTVAGQVLLPMVGDLAKSSERGKMIGIVTSGITIGILFARIISGAIAEFGSWRTVYIMALVLNLALTVVIFKVIPSQAPRPGLSYPKLIASVFLNIARLAQMRRILLIQGCGFLVFNLFWTSVTFLLSSTPYGYNTFQIGLVSLAALTGALISASVGKLQDKGVGVPALGIFLLVALIGMVVAVFSATSLVFIVVAAAIMAIGFQGMSILDQSMLFTLNPEARSRLNTAYMVSNFIFSAIGSALASSIWRPFGWTGVCLVACAVFVIAIVIWFFSKKMFSDIKG